jgi:hypothetical protein
MTVNTTNPIRFNELCFEVEVLEHVNGGLINPSLRNPSSPFFVKYRSKFILDFRNPVICNHKPQEPNPNTNVVDSESDAKEGGREVS